MMGGMGGMGMMGGMGGMGMISPYAGGVSETHIEVSARPKYVVRTLNLHLDVNSAGTVRQRGRHSN